MKNNESRFWGLDIFGIFSLKNKEVGQFAQQQFAENSLFSDPALIDSLLENCAAHKYKELIPGDLSKMLLGPENCGLIGDKKGFCRVFVDPAYPEDPDRALVLYFSLGKERSDGKVTLNLETAILGAKANIVMVYKKPCCSEMSVLVDAKNPNGGRIFQIRDGQKGTHDGEKGRFYARDASGALIKAGGQPLPLINRVPSDSDLQALANRTDLDETTKKQTIQTALNIGPEMAHRFMHAKDKPHHCHEFKVSGPKPA